MTDSLDPFAGLGPVSPGIEVRPSPNIWGSPAVYEIENHAVDRGGLIESTMRSIADWAGKDVLDVGCGTGFHLPRFAASARSVVGIEPHPPLAAIARLTRRKVDTETLIGRSSSALEREDSALSWLKAALGEAWMLGRGQVIWRGAGLRRTGVVAQLNWPEQSTRLGLGTETAVAHALVDLSDGIAGDAARIAARSGCRVVLEPERIPRAPRIEEVADLLFWTMGEDYELLAALAPEDVEASGCTVVGGCVEGEGVEPSGLAGWDSFA